MLIISRDMLSLLRDKEKRHKLPDVFEILFHDIRKYKLYELPFSMLKSKFSKL